MDLVPTSFVLADASTKWALVTVADAEGRLIREFTIDGPEAAAIVAGLQDGTLERPPGVTAEEWASGGASFTTRPLKPGMARVIPDGTLVLNYGVVTRLGKVQTSLLRLPAREFKVEGDTLYLPPLIAKAVDKSWL